jgi:peptide-methionine (S)-S-oxide reductase
VRCLVGYSGGIKNNPTYRNIMDYTEALLVEYDPKLCTYEDLVIEWSRMHSPTGKSKCQYRSAVWYLTEEQKEVCEQVMVGMKATYGERLSTSIEPATRFFQAEEYHQNFTAKMSAGSTGTNRFRS